MSHRVVASAFVLVALFAMGCTQDVSSTGEQPLDLSSADGGAGNQADAASTAADAARFSTVEGCRACMSGPGGKCVMQYNDCAAGIPDPRYKSLVDCLIDTNCLSQINYEDPAHPPQCALQCFGSAGVTSANDAQEVTGYAGLCLVSNDYCGHECAGNTN